MSSAIVASFRDPAGRLLFSGGRIFRTINNTGLADFQAFMDSQAAAELLKSGHVVGTRILGATERQELLRDENVRVHFDAANAEAIAEHERIEFPSFPYEWPPEMLHAAGLLTLELALALLPEDVGLKDATPYNILFRGSNPVFIDVLSFERRTAGDAIWRPYAQFARTFLLPLLANKHYGLALDQILLARRDGLEPEEVYRWTKLLERIRPPFLTLVTLPAMAGRRHDQDDTGIYKQKVGDPEKARFILERVLKGLRNDLEKVKPAAGKRSVWTEYMTSNNNYSAEHIALKQQFVERAVSEHRPKRVLDVGCNTGFFSAIAARGGARVVAIDYDPVVAGQTWRNAREAGLDIQPLVVNLTRPTPGVGWRNRECASFLDRARGQFDAVFMLAVIHHMLVTERTPLEEIIDLAAELTNDLLIIEFIAPQDSMFVRLTRGREELHQGLDTAVFENTCRRRFEIAGVQHLEGTSRWMYAMRKKRG